MSEMGERLRISSFSGRRPKLLALILFMLPAAAHAEGLAPLRIDPALLGGAAVRAPVSGAARAPATVTRPAAGAIAAPAMSTDERPEFSDGETTIRAQNIRGVRSIEVIAEGDAEVER